MVSQDEKNKALDELHFELHLARKQITKPTSMEIRLSYIISNLYKDTCSECNQVIERKKLEAENIVKGNVPQQRSMFDKILGK